MDRRIRIRHLQALTEIARQGSLKRAAARLYLTQPAISRTLSELEQIVGTALLTRDRGGISMTPQGEFFLRYAQSSLQSLEQGLSGIGQAGGPGAVGLRVGALPSVAALLMPGVVADLSRTAPEFRLVLSDGPHGHLTALLQAGDLDLLIGRLGAPNNMRGLSFSQLYLEAVAVVVRPGHPILRDPDLRAIADWPVIYPPPGAAIRPFVERLLIAQGIPMPPRRIETVSADFGRAMTQQSDAVWIISEGVVARDLAAGTLAALPVDTVMTAGPVGIMTRDDDPASAARQMVAQAVRRATAHLGLMR